MKTVFYQDTLRSWGEIPNKSWAKDFFNIWNLDGKIVIDLDYFGKMIKPALYIVSLDSEDEFIIFLTGYIVVNNTSSFFYDIKENSVVQEYLQENCIKNLPVVWQIGKDGILDLDPWWLGWWALGKDVEEFLRELEF